MKLNTVITSLLITFFFASCRQNNEQLLEKANNLSREKKFREAIDLYNKVLEKNSKLQLAYYGRGGTYFALKKYENALQDFNRVIALQTNGNMIVSFNQNTPFTNEEVKMQVSYLDALYQRAQVKFFMDSLKSSFIDFETLIENNYEEKSNCWLWQGTILIKNGKVDKSCTYFKEAKQIATDEDDKNEADKMIKAYCK